MLDSIIKMLGGVTKHEYDLQNVTLDAWRNRAIAAETTVALFKEIMERKEAAASNSENRQPPSMQPVGERKLSSWPRIKRELEKQDRDKSHAQVSREEIEREIRGGQ